MLKLTDTQSILLSGAAQRPDGLLLPAPSMLKCGTGAMTKAIVALLKNGLAQELPVAGHDQVWRVDGDERFGAVINDAGRVAIGVEPEGGGSIRSQTDAVAPAPSTDPAHSTKTALVLSLLRREQGATLAELVEATGWLPHTTRAALTGIRKKGHAVAKHKREDVTCYTLAA